MTTDEKKKRQMPKGGRKGGASFPRIPLQDAVGYARKLVSKTHTSAQPRGVIYSGVVGAKSGLGDVRISALKQYGFIKGDAKSGYSADELAKKISSAPEDELPFLYRKAGLKPTVFKALFDTFNGDTVTKAKLKQRAADLKVHPEETEKCVELYAASLSTAGLAAVEGDRVTHLTAAGLSTIVDAAAASSENDDTSEQAQTGEVSETKTDADTVVDTIAGESNNDNSSDPTRAPPADSPPTQRAVFNVNVTLDSSGHRETAEATRALKALWRDIAPAFIFRPMRVISNSRCL